MKTEYTDGYFNVSKKYGFLPIHNCLNDTNFPNEFKYLKDSYSKINKPVYDLTKIMKLAVPKYLAEGKYLYWRGDTHWNYNGILESMNFVNSIIKK